VLNKAAPPVYLGGVSANVGGTLERRLATFGYGYVRTQLSAAAFMDATSVVTAGIPWSVVGGWHLERANGTNLRMEAGLWFPNRLCPHSFLVTCRVQGGSSWTWDRWWGAAPIPIGVVQMDHLLLPRLRVTLRASKDARPTLLYAFVDEKRVDASLTSLLAPTLQLKGGAGLSWLSYGAAFDPQFSRNALQPINGVPNARVLELMGRQDGVASADVALRWIVAPWLVLSLQKSMFLLVTSVEVHRSDGAWENPGLVRSLSAAAALLQW